MTRHTFVSAVADGADTTQLQPSNWNAAHLSPYFHFEIVPTSGSITAGATIAERSVNSRRPGALLVGYTQARLIARVSSNANTNASAELRIQWSSDLSAWSYLDGSAGPGVTIATGTGDRTGSWVTMTGVPTTEVTLRVVQLNGDGTNSVGFQSLYLQLKG